MKNLMRKISVGIAFLMIASISHAHGDCMETQECFSCEPACCGNGFVGVELIYWRAFQNGLDVCVPTEDENITVDDRVISSFRGKGHNQHFNWNPGFRIGAGYQLACSDWDFGAAWTHFHSNANHWNLDFDVIDVVAGYRCDLCTCFVLRPFLGVRGARIDQHFHFRDFDDSSSSSSSSSLISFESNNKEKFWGVGPLMGLEFDWNIGCGYSFYTTASVAWLYGNYDVDLYELLEGDDFIDIYDVSRNPDGTLTSVDAGIGIRWRTCICNMQLFLQLGLEHHSYFDFSRIADCGDLSFDGVSFGLGLGF